MTRRRVYLVSLLLGAAVLWTTAAWRYNTLQRSTRPGAAARTIQHDLARRYAALQSLLDNGLLISALYENRESDPGFNQWIDAPFAIFLYEEAGLRAWNSGDVPAPEPAPLTRGDLVTTAAGSAIRIAGPVRGGRQRSFVALLPVKRMYGVENSYLGARFEASANLPAELEVADTPSKSGAVFKSPEGSAWGAVRAPAGATLPPAAPDWLTLTLFFAGLALFAMGLHAIMLRILARIGGQWALAVPLLLVGGLRAVSYLAPLPLGLRELPLFSSGLYALSEALPSLGDLLINTLCLLAITGFATAHSDTLKISGASFKPLRPVIGGGALGLLTLTVFATVRIVQSLVLDSQIPFDVGRFYTVNEYTAVGFGALGVLSAGTALAFPVLGRVAATALPAPGVRYSLLFCLGMAIGFLLFRDVGPLWLVASVAVWTVLFLLLMERPWPIRFAVASAPRIVTGMVLLALSVGGLLHHYLLARTYRKDMVAFATRVVGQEDPLLQYTLSSTLSRLANDGDLQAFLNFPSAESRAMLEARLEALYFSQPLAGYTPHLAIFSETGRSLFNQDTLSVADLEDRLAFSYPIDSGGLFYNPTAADGRHYTARVPLTRRGEQSGTLYIDFLLRRTVAETVYPELLQPELVQSPRGSQAYPYAVYAGGLPVTQTEDYPFPEAVPASHKITGTAYRTRAGRRELLYYDADDRLVIVVGPARRLLDSAALFSYLFAVLLVLAGLAVVYRRSIGRGGFRRRALPARVPRLSLRQGIHLSMLGIVLLSLLGVGAATVALFNSRYREATDARLRSTVQTIGRSVRQSLAGRPTDPGAFDSVAASPQTRYNLATLSDAQKADVSVFGLNGMLLVSSQEEIYNRGLLPRQMRPEAYRSLRRGQPVVLQRERVGTFAYQSAYVPLRSEEGRVLGYVNVPFFSSERELNDQISGILVTLVNLYALLFLLATGLAYLITRGLTRTLAVITARLQQVSLHRNEVLEWPYDDEIGLLVREYNKMVRAVEQSAASLARSEREGAWREMARQVAHEIKNPLTPMKLQIQYLQRALHEERADVPALAGRVSTTLIEQIDNLSRIATEFSDFARLPEAQPEVLQLGPLLQRTADLYRADGQADVSVTLPPEPVVVRADHSHLLRTLTNLLQNAVQAVPEDRAARIGILLKTGARAATVRIADNGRGISGAEQSRIFQPYFTTKSSGTGLGLAMTRQMVEGWGGRIWFESREGEGTEFFVEIPLAAQAV